MPNTAGVASLRGEGQRHSGGGGQCRDRDYIMIDTIQNQIYI
jgi:hypothetical protein